MSESKTIKQNKIRNKQRKNFQNFQKQKNKKKPFEMRRTSIQYTHTTQMMNHDTMMRMMTTTMMPMKMMIFEDNNYIDLTWYDALYDMIQAKTKQKQRKPWCACIKYIEMREEMREYAKEKPN